MRTPESHWEPYFQCAGFIIILNLQLAICSTHTCLSRGYNRRSMGHASVKEILEGKISIFKFKAVINIKGQLISKKIVKAEDSSKKRTNEFVFTSMRRVFVRFFEEFSARKNRFEII